MPTTFVAEYLLRNINNKSDFIMEYCFFTSKLISANQVRRPAKFF